MARSSPLALPGAIQGGLDAAARTLLTPEDGRSVDFTQPPGEEALVAPDSVSWRVFKNPVSLFIGGVAAVILELAEPGVRTGVWEHSTFRADPIRRMKRTGLAAMVTVYGARSRAEAMIAGVGRMHARVGGDTPAGKAYQASDPELLAWVHATAVFGFGEAYSRYVHPLSAVESDRLYAEGAPAARLYGALGAPTSQAQVTALFETMRERLEPSPIVFEFLDIVTRAPVFPPALRGLQAMFVGAAVELTPDWVRERLGLTKAYGLGRWRKALVRQAGGVADRIVLASSPGAQSCLRLDLPADYLYRR